MKVKKGDEVLVTVGKDKGKKGKVEKVDAKRGTVFLPGLNIFKRHLKKRDEKSQGGIIPLSRPIPFSNVAIVCSKCGKPTRVGFQEVNGKKMRICRKCGSKL